MANPFHYSKTKHIRTESPPAYSRYRKFKPHLRIEFSGRCVYCRALDRIKGPETFGVDHYRPQNHFPLLSAEYLNLYYACNLCNSRKSDFWPSSQLLKLGRFIPNPCDHVMFEHLRYKHGTVTSTSNAGEWTIEHLDLNDPEAVHWRETVIGVVDLLLAQIQKATSIVADADKRLAAASTPAEKANAESLLDQAQQQLTKSSALLQNFADA